MGHPALTAHGSLALVVVAVVVLVAVWVQLPSTQWGWVGVTAGVLAAAMVLAIGFTWMLGL